ncbi:Hypothetical predicted protein [Lecanosticta acicola]|uniref:KOW domain-containing protein n=1 Tax=Lecanosticta acicola TaxID=111012 RepID=A0AAI8YZY2_9PEZI|nr:Hypothetical predicted protein [Lecanosticta acicola]
MQRVVQRAKRAERVATRQLEKQKRLRDAGEGWGRKQAQLQTARRDRGFIRQERRQRKEDWELGPLAPRRDAGDKRTSYGSISIYEWIPGDVDPKKRVKWWHIAAGDRVVMLTGRDRGKIGTVSNVHPEKNALQIRNLNMYDVWMPEWMRSENNDDRHVVPTPGHVSLDDVRLVYPLPDPETGIPRDVVIDRLESKFRMASKKDEDERGERVIPGTNIMIPWPAKADDRFEDHEIDTPRLKVEEETFRPYLLRPIMPLSVIDELRNKYSRFRTRHDYEYIQQKELEDSKTEGRKELIKTMRTPMQELAALRAAQKQAQPPKELTQDQLAKIGEVIVREGKKAEDAIIAAKKARHRLRAL